jgi:cell division septation protein DedD
MRAPATRDPTGPAELPVDAGVLHPEGDGFFERRRKARRARLLAGLADVLRRALAPGEVVRWAARGVRYSFVEHLFGGAAAQQRNRVALVLTDRRLLLVQVDRKGGAGDVKNEVPLAAIREVGKGMVALRLRLADGTKLQFSSVPGRDRKRLQALIPTTEGPRSTQASVVHLCPACLRPVPGPVGAVPACPQPDCRIPFRDPAKAGRLSALVPGLGSLYLRDHLFGSIELLGSMLVLGVALAFVFDAASARRPPGVVAAVLFAIALIALPRLVAYRKALSTGRYGLIPLALRPAPGGQARNLPSLPVWTPLLVAAGLALAGGIAVAIAQDLRRDRIVDEAAALAASGRLDDAHARWAELERAGDATETRRVKFALALLDAGDLVGAGELEARFKGAKVEAGLAERWNAASAREQAALADYREGVKALVAGDAAAWTRLDRALAYFRGVKRPHLPATRGEIHAHLAEGALGEPLSPGDLERARSWLDAVADAPAAEVAVVRAAYDSAAGARAQARSALGAVDETALPVRFRLLALEARARLAESDAERAEVRGRAAAFPQGLDADEAKRLAAVVERVR